MMKVSIVSGVLMFVLFLSELNYYLTTEVRPELFVDTSRSQKLRINVDVTLPRVGCSYVSIDAMDVSGEQQIDIDHDIFKQRIDLDGFEIKEQPKKEELGDASSKFLEAVATTLDPQRCESCYGAESPTRKCCNTCADVRDAYRQRGWAFPGMSGVAQCQREGLSDVLQEQQNEGCRLYGYLQVNKVAGNFHIAPGKSFQQHHAHVHDMQAFGGMKFNMSHRVNHLSFGTDYPGQVNPLDASHQHAEKDSVMFQYFIKIVPTMYAKLEGELLSTNQYSVTKHSKVVTGGLMGDQGLPGIFFTYELSPMMVKYTEKNRSFMHFLTGVCAIVGGLFTVAGLVDSFIYRSSKVIQKMELGKAS